MPLIPGTPGTVAGSMGFRTTSVYDTSGRAKATINPLGFRNTTVYNAAGDTIATINPLGFRATTVYNIASDAIASIQPLLQRTSMVYNTAGQQVATVDPLSHRTTSVYDTAGRMKATINPLGFRTTSVFDKSRTVASIDANSNRTTTVYDVLGRPEVTVDAESDRTTNVYDAGGRTVAKINELGNRWSMVYDAANQQTQKIDPLNNAVQFRYNADGSRSARIDARGNRTTYAYDPRGLTTGWKYPDGTRVTFAYDAVGSRTMMANATGRYSLTYDELNRKQQAVLPGGQVLTYVYDGNGRRSRLSTSAAGLFTYAYDNNSRLTLVQNPQSDRTSFIYDDAGLRMVKYLSNGARTTYTYDDAGRLTRIANITSGSVTLSSFDYEYDPAGNRTVIAESGGAVTSYSYDQTYQLTAEHRTGSSAYRYTYTYDDAGNRLVKNLTGTRTTSVFDAADRTRYEVAAGGRTTLSYDADGNRTVELAPGGARTTTTYDYENRRSLVILPSSIRNTMAYDPTGLRVKLEESAGTKKFVYDGQAYLLETDNANALTAAWTQEPTLYGNLISQRRGSTTNWHLFDATGSTRQLLDNTQAVTDAYLYDANGNILSSGGSTVNPFQWHGAVGYYRDPDTGLYYVRARPLDPVRAVWIVVDPAGFRDGMNPYFLYFVPNGTDASGMQNADGIDDIINEIISMLPNTGVLGFPLETCPFPNPVEACAMYIKLFEAIETIYGDPFAGLPCCPPKLPSRCETRFVPTSGYGSITFVPITYTTFYNPDPVAWTAFGPPICCHPGASNCMRSNVQVPFQGPNRIRPAQQCCYDNNGNLLSGTGAGTPDLVDSANDPLLHNALDVASWACCKEAQALGMYLSMWRPNKGCAR